MKDKKRMVWIISVVCIILAVAFCAVSIAKMNRLQKQARDLETEVARLMSEQNEKQTETLTETEDERTGAKWSWFFGDESKSNDRNAGKIYRGSGVSA